MTEDFSQWRELRRINNCYLVWDEITREAALFDLPPDLDPVFQIIDTEGIQLRHVFLTHEQSADALRARVPKFLLHSNSKDAPPQHRNRANDFIHLGSLRITNRGLMDDKVAYIIGNWPEDAPHVAIVGDIKSITRETVREKILTLPQEAVICPHNEQIMTVARLAADLNSQLL